MSSSTTLESGVICNKKYRCKLPRYGNTQYCVLHFPSADKIADFEHAFQKKFRSGNFDFRGVWFPEKKDFSKFPFTAEVNFEEATFNGEADFRFATFSGEATFLFTNFCEEAKFGSVKFEKPVTFRGAHFFKKAGFDSATFNHDVNFRSRFKGKVEFSQCVFGQKVDFRNATFEKDANFFAANFDSITNFDTTTFHRQTNFDGVTFGKGGVNFNSATFRRTVTFRGAHFHDRVLFDVVQFRREANFHLSNFKDFVRFKGKEGFVFRRPPNFREVKFDNPKMVSFHSCCLRPFWFVEVDATEFTFTNVNWNSTPITVKQEIEGIIQHYEERPSNDAAYPLLAISCWNLALNAEENHRYQEASQFRGLAMEVRHRELTRERGSGDRDTELGRISRLMKRSRHFWSSRLTLPNVYRLLSGYGENIQRALLVLILILAVFGGIYAIFWRDPTGVRLGWRGFPYSAAVMALQAPEPRPSPGIEQAVVTLETVLSLVQVALLALAVRRKFMR